MNVTEFSCSSRRRFLIGAFGGIAVSSLGVLKNVEQHVSANDSPSNQNTKSVPLFLSQRTFDLQIRSPIELAKCIGLARDEWGFSGFELSLASIERLAGSVSLDAWGKELSEELTKIGFEDNRERFQLTLSVICDECDKSLKAAAKLLDLVSISRCSIVVPEKFEPNKLQDLLEQWRETLGAVSRTTQSSLMLETPSVYSGLEFFRLAELMEKVNQDVGVLIRSSTSHYRFDLALQDLQLAFRQSAQEAEGIREVAVRFTIDVDRNRTVQQLEFEREMYHRSIVEQLAPRTKKVKPAFIALESTSPISWDNSTASGNKSKIDSELLNDAIELIQSDLNSIS